MPPPVRNADKYKEPRPKNIREVPRYLRRLIGGFFHRLFYIFGIVWECSPLILILMSVLALLHGVLPVVGAYIGAAILNALAGAITGTVAFSAIFKLLIIQFVYLFGNRLATEVNTIVTRIAGEKVSNHIKMRIMHKAKELDLSNFDLPDFYERLDNANREAGMRPLQILNATFTIVSSIISMVSFIVILWAVTPLAPVTIVAVSIPSAIVNFIYRGKNVKYFRFHSKERRQMWYYSDLLVNKDMAKEIRLYGLSDNLIERYKAVFLQYFNGLKRLILGEGGFNVGLNILSTAVHCGFFLYIAKGVFDGNMQLGDYSLYTGALTSIAGGVTSLISTTATIYEGTLFIENLIIFLQEERRIVPLLPTPAPITRHIGHTFRFENVSFAYPGTSRMVLQNINLEIGAGETIVLVGLNGAGKTTLLKLLLRLYDPTEGTIYMDGKDIRSYDPTELYRIFGIIFQDFGKYAATAGDNIAFGQIERDMDKNAVVAAAKQGNAHDYINALPLAYDT
ncbi:MAG: ABC transporter ATP-binding protein, partial [Clostridia bacterium]|nr:ABC transporter ATP-binding protein [Clostridia bacterium]